LSQLIFQIVIERSLKLALALDLFIRFWTILLGLRIVVDLEWVSLCLKIILILIFEIILWRLNMIMIVDERRVRLVKAVILMLSLIIKRNIVVENVSLECL
jgi:hypothetical protein